MIESNLMASSAESTTIDVPEHAVLLAAASVAERAAADVDEALRRPLDWKRVVELALQHRMTPALLAALERADSSLVPADLLQALRHHCGRLCEQSSALVHELFAVLSSLAERSVIAVPFKGPLLAEMVFGDFSLRCPGDLDLLIRQQDADLVCDVLESRGYHDAGVGPGKSRLNPAQRRIYERLQCEYQFVRPSDDMVVEPHWAFSQRALAIDLDCEGIYARAQPTVLAGRSVQSFIPSDLLLTLAIHGSKHNWERLSWIRDVAAVLNQFPELDLATCLADARRSGCGRILLLSLWLAHQGAGADLPAVIHRELAADPMVEELGQRTMLNLFKPAQAITPNDQLDNFRLRMRERWHDRCRYVTRTLFSPQRRHLEIVSLPGVLGWGYFPIAWGMKFAVGPAWKLLKPVLRRFH